jgi:flagellar biogenesis protein FliO
MRRVLLGVVAAFCLIASAHGADKPMAERAPPPIPFKQSEQSAGGLALRVFGGLIVVALMGVGAVYVLKRYLPTVYRSAVTDTARIKLVEVRRLTPKTTLFLVELDGVSLLLGDSGDGLTVLHQAPKRAGDRDVVR